MMFEAMAFKFCPIHIKLSTLNFKLKKALSHEDSAFFFAHTCNKLQCIYFLCLVK